MNNRLLYLFALADTRGRHAKEMTRPEENLHLWKLVAEEHGCFDHPYAFANDQARFLFYRDQLSSLHYTPHEDYRCTVTLMSGFRAQARTPGSPSIARTLPVVALDAIREDARHRCYRQSGRSHPSRARRCREHLRAGQNFAFNATNITRQMRKRWIELFADYGARIEIVYLEPPIATLLAQNKRRTNPVPEKVILRLLEKLEPPTVTECHSLTFA